MFRVYVLLLAVITVSGCSTTSIKSDFSIEDSKQGIAVFSVTNDKKPGTGNAKAIFYMNGQSSGKKFRQLESTEEAFPGGWKKRSEFYGVQGRLFAINLPPGEHQLTSWKIFNGTGMYIEPRNKPTPLVFEIKEGEIKYLGNFHMNLLTGKNVFGITITGKGYPEIKDMSDRDIPMFEKRYPQFSGKVVKDVLNTGEWLSGNDETE